MKTMKTVLAVVAAIAVLATAMTGFAATVSTQTEYNMNSVYAGVTTTVSGATGEVALVVTTTGNAGVDGTGILYIDQKTASGSDVVFNYSVAKENINNLETEVVLGTTGVAIEQPADGLGIVALADVDAATYTIDFVEDAYGLADDTVAAYISAKGENEITSITIGDDVYTGEDIVSAYSVAIADVDAITVETQAVVQTPEKVAEAYEFAPVGDNYSGTAIIKISGSLAGYEAGVTYKGDNYKAIGELNENGYIAVKIIDTVEIAEGDLVAYFVEAE